MCWGANVAFEMAQQLRRAGERVDLLACIDGQRPPVLRSAAARAGGGRRAPDSPGAYIVGRLRVLRTVLNYMWSPQGRRLIAIQHIHKQARVTYRADPYDGDIDLFRIDSDPRAPLYEAQWRALTTATFRAHILSGTHGTIMEAPHVSLLARLLRSRLDEAAARGRAP
jgi:thioesterase domain-containing protein